MDWFVRINLKAGYWMTWSGPHQIRQHYVEHLRDYWRHKRLASDARWLRVSAMQITT